ncbi:hypothetical protein N9D31_04185, partial [Oligoflexaceae bacterium]|nr:hypothetical protein [Oligoflexaceae bacterium]
MPNFLIEKRFNGELESAYCISHQKKREHSIARFMAICTMMSMFLGSIVHCLTTPESADLIEVLVIHLLGLFVAVGVAVNFWNKESLRRLLLPINSFFMIYWIYKLSQMSPSQESYTTYFSLNLTFLGFFFGFLSYRNYVHI